MFLYAVPEILAMVRLPYSAAYPSLHSAAQLICYQLRGRLIMELPEPTSDIEKGKANLDLYGVTIHKNFLGPDLVKILRARLEEQADLEIEQGVASFAYEVSEDSNGESVGRNFRPYVGRPVKKPPLQMINSLVNKGRVFIDLAKNPVALAYAAHAFKSIPFNVGYQDAAIIRRGAPAQPIHIDQQPVPFSTPIPLSINVMVALGDFKEDMGATRMVPGSHKHEISGVDPDAVDSVPAIMEPGSALVWESRTWHGQGSSFSDNPRVSVATMYTVHFLKSPENFPASIHDTVFSTLSDEERCLYDFDFLGYSGRVGPRSLTDERGNVANNVLYIPELSRDGNGRAAVIKRSYSLPGKEFGKWNE